MSLMVPEYTTLYEEIGTRIEQFYAHGSILTENKYIVGLSGEYVKKAVEKMEKNAKPNSYRTYTGRETGNPIPKNIYTTMFERWAEVFSPTKKDVELRWTVSNVVIPQLKPKISKTFSMDSIKTIWYPMITGCEDTGKITLTIVEERGMGMFQFFNALMNQFFNTQMLKPKSSFQKVGMYIIMLNGEYIPNMLPLAIRNPSDTIITDIPLQIFEFNSIVPLGIDQITGKQGDTNGLITFKIDFEAPNIFQGTYSTTTLKGLMDNTTDSGYMDGYVYNRKQFTTGLKNEGNIGNEVD